MSLGPLVSIVLPTYNGSRYLDGSIESIVRQDYSHWELILVDDASTDATPQIIAEWTRRDPRIQSVRNERNRKLPASLNRGFRQTQGGLLTWTSDDNLYRPEALKTLVRFLEQNPATAMVYADFTEIDDQGRFLRGVRVEPPEKLTYYNCVWGCFLYRREVYSRIGDYNENFFLVEDWDYWLRAARYFELAPLHEELYVYRRHEGSLTVIRQREVARAVETLLELHLSDPALFSREIRARAFLPLMEKARGEGRRRDAWRYFGRSLKIAPRILLRERRAQLLRFLLGESAANWLLGHYRRQAGRLPAGP